MSALTDLDAELEELWRGSNLTAAQAVLGARNHVSAIDFNRRAQPLERHNEEIHRACADRAAP